MKKTLYDELKQVVDGNIEYAIMRGMVIPRILNPPISDPKRQFFTNMGIIEEYSDRYPILKEVINKKMSIPDLIIPIEERVNQLEEEYKSKRIARFRPEQIFDVDTCKEATSKLEGILDPKKYYKSSFIFEKKITEFFRKCFGLPKEGFSKLNTLKAYGRVYFINNIPFYLLGGFVGYNFGEVIPKGVISGNLVGAGICAGAVLGPITQAPFIYFIDRNFHEMIKKPTLKLKEDAIFVQETIEKIYKKYGLQIT